MQSDARTPVFSQLMREVVAILCVIASIVFAIGFVPAHAHAQEQLTAGSIHLVAQTSGIDDYPAACRDVPKDSIIDPWRFYNRECVSFVAWRLNNDNGIPFTCFTAV